MSHCMLAGRYLARRTRYPVRVETKIDGQRCVVRKAGGIVTMLSRIGRAVTDVPELAEAVARAPIDNVVIDCELASLTAGAEPADRLAALAWWLSAKPALHVFDCLPVETWDVRGTSAPLIERVADVARVVAAIGHERVRAVTGCTVETEAELDAYYRAAVERGEEGIVVKSLAAPYLWQRSIAWSKRKPSETE